MYGELPLLQAVVVCVKRFPYDEVDVTRIPQPTILREGPGSFGLEITEFYLNPTLGHCLDLKLQRFLNIPNNLQFLYERVMRKIDLMEEQELKAELRKVDSQGCISCGPCSCPELTEDHVLPSAYVKIFRIVTRNAVNKSF